MRNVGWGAFVLLAIGTIGLLINEFFGHWGRGATLTFAALNVVGLVLVLVTLQVHRDR